MLASANTSPMRSITYLLISNDIIPEHQLGFGWRDAIAAMWSGDYDGTPRLIRMDLAAGTATDDTNAALIDLADRAHQEGETPKHLEAPLRAAGLDFPLERPAYRYRAPVTGPLRVGSVFLR